MKQLELEACEFQIQYGFEKKAVKLFAGLDFMPASLPPCPSPGLCLSARSPLSLSTSPRQVPLTLYLWAVAPCHFYRGTAVPPVSLTSRLC